MQARLSHYTVEPERIDEAIRGFEEAAESLRDIEGNVGGYLLVDRDQGKLITLTFWEDQAALTKSEVRAASLRRRAVSGAEGTVEAVYCYDVPLDFSALTHS
jgi:heme-degrading monooxygenase HmoA